VPRAAAIVSLALAVLGLGACGGGDDNQQVLVVSAASSLQDAFTEYAQSFPGADIKQSFAGSDQLAAQIRQGARPDVYAAASTDYPDELYKDGLVEKPRVFAANRLVIAVPKDSNVHSLSDLAESGVTLVIGDPSVPVGSYTREVLDGLPAPERAAILANVRSEEPEVAGIVAKLTGGAADAGFVYVTDVKAAGPDLRAIRVPAGLQPDVAYGVAIVKGASNSELARHYVNGLFNGAGKRALHATGFLPPP
jgi:molybdate transport system substrate-binding protein